MPDAQYNLALMYGGGEGVAQDWAAAARWYRVAAAQNYAGAQHNLGVLHESGLGVAQDRAEAARLYQLAAAQGYTRAQVNLGGMYAYGEGVAQDKVAGYMWLTIALGGSSGEVRSAALQNLAAIEKTMTAAEIAEARRRAGEWGQSPP